MPTDGDVPVRQSLEAGPTEAPAVDADLFTIGSGSVRTGPLEPDNPESLVVLDAPPTQRDDRGVWAARGGRALIVVSRDRTRVSDLTQLADRLRAAGVAPIGIVLTGGHRG